ncbi:MAG: hypothetical protein N4A71_10400 [Carboxylicivirga sp.]|jgi:small-conductance mechanosensitive channel|nr:hypothetical protein [Carboxylicivirga sp.]MCT4645388.1 hypothetical protein [Carboxylicivirga sp.]
MNLNEHQTEDINMDSLIAKMQKEDSNYAKLCNRLQWLYWVLAPLYLIMIAIHYFDDGTREDMIGNACFFLAMLSFGLLLRKYQKEYQGVNYALPTLQMLKQAVNRYSPFTKRTLLVVPGVVLAYIGFLLSASKFSSPIFVHAFFSGAILVGLTGGLIYWKSKYKPLRDEAKKMLQDIENG